MKNFSVTVSCTLDQLLVSLALQTSSDKRQD